MKQTNSVDSIECPYCGEFFNGREACNGDMDCRGVACPKCDKYMSISISVEFLAETAEE